MNKKTNKQKVKRKSTIVRHNQLWKEYFKLRDEIGIDVFVGLSKNYVCGILSDRTGLHCKSIQQILNKSEYIENVK